MYLSLLNDNQKSLFLSIALYLAKVDNDYSEEERRIIQSYCVEMNITEENFVHSNNIMEIISSIDECSDNRAKRIIVLEAVGLAIIDGDYSENEKKVIKLMNTYFGLDDCFLDQCENLISQFVEFQKQFNQLIL